MLQVKKASPEAASVAQAERRSNATPERKIEHEMTALLKRAFTPLFEKASSWKDLQEKLIARGYDFRFEDGQLILVEVWHGSRVCSCGYLGFSLQTLSERLGKLRARPPREGEGYGDLAI